MAQNLNFRVDIRPYSGYTDPSLPIGEYIGQLGAVGDASGGNILLNFLFQFSEDARISELFNLEQLSVDTTATTAIAGTMATLNMDALSPARAGSPQIWALPLIAAGGITALDLEKNVGLPLWLGAPNQDAPSGNGGLRFTFVNTDLRLFAITIQGYVWGPRAVMAAGGPQRPLGRLFR